MSEPAETSSPYYLAVSYQQERRARQAYDQAKALLFGEECDLSAFRLYAGPTWYVVIVGDPPVATLEAQLQHIFRRGDPATLPTDVIDQLQQRRAHAAVIGPWVERHHRPCP
jgi:hypothetical protein